MNIENLECFLSVAENLSFARAAKSLHISQPAVTKQIHVLERELGISLFARSTRHVELTPAGEAFYQDAKEIVLKTRMAVSRVQRQGSVSDAFRVGVSTPSILFFLQNVLRQFHLQYPKVRPDIECMNYRRVLNLFMENKLDVLFYYKENLPKEYAVGFLELRKDRICCLVPVDHPLAERGKVYVEDLREYDVIACSPLEAPLSIAAFQEKILEGHSPERVQYCGSVEAAHCLVGAGMGVSLLPEMLCLDTAELACIPIVGGTELSFGAFYHEQKRGVALERFLRLLSEIQT